MTTAHPPSRRRLLAPEVVQTSAMDCGPAALKCLLEGFGIPISYGRLREACQTDVDGTSIDTLEEAAVQLGLEAEQIMLPPDHVLLDESRSLPALVVVRLPDGMTHFEVAWRKHGRFVQVMDPGVGRRWLAARRFLDELHIHTAVVPAMAWREWAAGDEFQAGLRHRLSRLGLGARLIALLLTEASSGPDWKSAAALDAATRLVDSLVHSGGIGKGRRAAKVLHALWEVGRDNPRAGDDPARLPTGNAGIPATFWSVQPAPASADGEGQLFFKGAVLVRVLGRRRAADTRGDEDETAQAPPRRSLSPELAAALEEKPPRPARDLLRMLREDGLLAPAVVVAAILLAAAGVTVEALLLRGVFDLGKELLPPRQRLAALAALVAFVGLIALLELPIAASVLRFGRKLEARLRMAFLEKIPRLRDRYFHSRPTSDMAQRSHSVHELRTLPAFASQWVRTIAEMTFTVAGIIWLDPGGAGLAVLAAVMSVALPIAFQPLLAERDLRVRTHQGALARFYLDALMGLVPIRAHGAERPLRREHERVLAEWARAGLGLQRLAVGVEGIQSIVGLALATGLLFGYLKRTEDLGGILLMVYWALNLPALGQKVGLLAWRYPSLRNVTLRLFEPLGAPEEMEPATPGAARPTHTGRKNGDAASVSFQDVTVRAAGHLILEDVTLDIEAGSDVAIVGPSGAGKSSLVGVLLGWHRPAQGTVRVDGEPLDDGRLTELRRFTAWVDPTVQLWNRSLLDNLHYGLRPGQHALLAPAIDSADLRGLLETLPNGMQTALGEGGALVSGGEGQRVRFGRAVLRPDVRLVILDEPFRGLDREKRRALLQAARDRWKGATFLCITHDVGETLGFQRVLVLESGRIVEDGRPSELAANKGSRYRTLLEAEEELRKGLWSSAEWRRWRLEKGRVSVDGAQV